MRGETQSTSPVVAAWLGLCDSDMGGRQSSVWQLLQDSSRLMALLKEGMLILKYQV